MSQYYYSIQFLANIIVSAILISIPFPATMYINNAYINFSEMPHPDRSLLPEKQNKLTYDEFNYDMWSLVEEHRKLMSTMTTEEMRIYERIIKRVDENRPRLFCLYGYGGNGKTYI